MFKPLSAMTSITFILALTVMMSPMAQEQTHTITRAEFIAQFERLFKFAAERRNKNVNEDQYERLKEHLPAEEVEAIKREDELAEEERFKAVAKCMNMSTKQFTALRDSINPAKAGLEALKQCKDKIPSSITVNPLNVNYDTLPALKSYNECFVKVQSDLIGIDLSKVQECENQLADDF